MNNRTVWDTEKVKEIQRKIIQGYRFKNSPFFNNLVQWRKADIPFQMTKQEEEEYIKCANDIIYFAEKYCYLNTNNGYKIIKLRDYQKDMLNTFEKERMVITLASRQIGKCVRWDTKIQTKQGEDFIGRVYYKMLEKHKLITFIQKIKWYLWEVYVSL